MVGEYGVGCGLWDAPKPRAEAVTRAGVCRQVQSDGGQGLAVVAGLKAAWLFQLDLPAPVRARELSFAHPLGRLFP